MNCPTLFHPPMADWSHLVNYEIKLLAHQRLLSEEACYVQWDQPSDVIEDSRWQLLYLVVTQFPKKTYSLILVKSVTFYKLLLVQVS